ANDQFKARCRRFHHRIRRERRWNQNNRRVRACFAASFFYCIKNVDVPVLGTAFAWRHAANDMGAIVRGLKCVETPFSAGNALDNQLCVFIYEDTHLLIPFVAPTTFSAASFIPSATRKFSPELRRISWPCSTLVPSSRTTIGIFTPIALAASTTPDATTSHRII